MRQWKTINVGTGQPIPAKPGIYLLYVKGEKRPIFIGAAANLSSRIRTVVRDFKWHHDEIIERIKFSVEFRDKADLGMLEAKLIFKLMPRKIRYMPSKQQLRSGKNYPSSKYTFYHLNGTRKRQHVELTKFTHQERAQQELERIRKRIVKLESQISEMPSDLFDPSLLED